MLVYNPTIEHRCCRSGPWYAQTNEGFIVRKLSAVENARNIMTQGTEWGVWKWLTEKKRVREAADQARAALDALEKEIKSTWSEELKLAYTTCYPTTAAGSERETKRPHGRESHQDLIRRRSPPSDESYKKTMRPTMPMRLRRKSSPRPSNI